MRCQSVAVVSLLFAGGVAAAPPPAPGRVGWQELRFAAHKMGITATVELRASRLGGDLLLQSTSHLPGRTFLARERDEPSGARAKEIVDTETGAKHHRKTYTLSETGYDLEVVEPASIGETLGPVESWSKITRTVAALPAGVSRSSLTGPAGLLWVASTAPLLVPGDQLTIDVLVQTQAERVSVAVEGVEPVDLEFEQTKDGGTTTVRERVDCLRLVARSRPVDPSSTSAFRLFGLEGDVTLLWDPVRRIPVEMAGQVKLLGRVVVRLTSVVLAPQP